MLNIQVLGRGAIPRGNGIAPRKDPFPADLETIELILKTGGLSIKFVNPTTGVLIPLTTANLKKMWKAYGDVETTSTSTSYIAYKPPLKKPDEPIREAGDDDFKEAIKTVIGTTDKSKEEKKEESRFVPAAIKSEITIHSNNKFDSEPASETKIDSSDSKNDSKSEIKSETPVNTDSKKESNKNDNKNASQSFKPVTAPEKK